MGWFGYRQSQYEIEPAESSADHYERAVEEAAKQQKAEEQRLHAIDQQKIEWVKNVSAAELLDVFAKLEFTTKNVTQNFDTLDTKDQAAWRKAVDVLTQIHHAWFEIDRHILNDEHALVLAQLIDEQLPQAITLYLSRSASATIHKAWDANSSYYTNSAARAFTKILNTVSTIRDTQITSFQLEDPTVVLEDEPEDKNLTFPNLATDNSTVMNTLTRVNELWKQAVSRKNSVEDEYFLEQVAHTYVPDSWRLFQTFRFAPEASQQVAESIFLEQLQLIENHLIHILSTAMTQNLMAMRSQLGFLEARTVKPAVSQLTLEAASQAQDSD
jgi:hypothetical protein